jgi:hypothetical protein
VGQGGSVRTYEITFKQKSNGDWLWWRIEAADFQAACENALQSRRDDLRLIRVEWIFRKEEN